MWVGVLGPLGIRADDGTAAGPAGPKIRGLLGALVAADGEAVPAERLIEAIWGPAAPADPTAALHTKVWQLRRLLRAVEPGAEQVVTGGQAGYAIDIDACRTDVRQFRRGVADARAAPDARRRLERLNDALAWWRGAAFADAGADAMDAVQPVVARLEEERLSAAEDRADAMVELGEHDVLIGELADLLARHPLRERLRAAHMRALVAAGRQGEALASYDELRNRLRDDLGLDPGERLSELHGAVLRRDPALLPAVPAAGPGPATNLPAAVLPLVGRRAALADVLALLDAHRLVTLWGAGGVGKTRLALAACREAVAGYPDGVWIVELSTLDRSDDEGGERFDELVELVASTMGLRDEVTAGTSAVPAVERLGQALRTRRTLLLLDNCEHVLGPAARLGATLLHAAPELRLLVTSREPLRVAGERVRRVPPLTLPDEPNVAGVARSSAGELLVARIAASVPGFVLDEDNVAAVHDVCVRLDGIPLALELAATRVRALGVRQVADRLADRFALLTMGERSTPTRQRTLRGAIEWSWELLDEPARILLRRLSVFSGDWSLDAAEQVCSGGGVPRERVVDLVTRLVEHSLVQATDTRSGQRYRLLESVVAFGAERRDEAGETAGLRRSHALHFAGLAERAAPHLRGPEQRPWLRDLDDEGPNLRLAIEYAVRDGLPDVAFRLVTSLTWYWFLRNRVTEAVRYLRSAVTAGGEAGAVAEATVWLAAFELRAGSATYRLEDYDALLAAVPSPSARARARWFLGFVRAGFGDLASTRAQLERALADFRALGDPWGVAACVGSLSYVHLLGGALPRAGELAAGSAARFRDIGDGWGCLQTGAVRATLAEIAGRFDEAAGLHREGRRLAESLDLWSQVSTALSGLGRIALLQGDLGTSRQMHERAMRLAERHGYTFGVQFAEVGLGMVARREGRLDEAESHLHRWLAWCEGLEGAPGSALILAELGFAAEVRGDRDRALTLHLSGYGAARASGDPRAVALAWEGVAGALTTTRPEHAARLLGAASALRDAVGAPLPAPERGDTGRSSEHLRHELADGFDALFDEGRAMRVEAVSALIPPDGAGPPMITAASIR